MFESREMAEGSAARTRRRMRRSPRTRFHLQVLDGTSRGDLPTTTEDVSLHGLALLPRARRDPGQLVKVTVVDPRTGERIRLMGVVARHVEVVDGRRLTQPAVAVSLYGNDRATEARWVDLVRAVDHWAARGRSRPPMPLPPPAEALVERLRLTPFAVHELRTFDRCLCGKRAVFLQGPRRVTPGTTVAVVVQHPATRATFELLGLVTRSLDSLDPSECGLDVLFDKARLDARAWGLFVRGAD